MIKSNVFSTLFGAISTKFKRGIDKLSNRISCEHLIYTDVHCIHTGLFLYKQCNNCGKKKSW